MKLDLIVYCDNLLQFYITEDNNLMNSTLCIFLIGLILNGVYALDKIDKPKLYIGRIKRDFIDDIMDKAQLVITRLPKLLTIWNFRKMKFPKFKRSRVKIRLPNSKKGIVLTPNFKLFSINSIKLSVDNNKTTAVKSKYKSNPEWYM